MKPTLLVIELWGVGDLVIATPFLRAASEKFDVTLLAKPYAHDLQKRFWPNVTVVTFTAPWTAFQGKYRLHKWPWSDLWQLRKRFTPRQFDFGLSARWDPRDHFFLRFLRAKKRLGYPRLGSGIFLTDTLQRPAVDSHRYENWRVVGRALGLDLPARNEIVLPPQKKDGAVLIHSGAGQLVRVWPLENYRLLANRLRKSGYRVEVACDVDQRDWWLRTGEAGVKTPQTVSELIEVVDRAGAFIGNDSGPGHLAAFCGVPTFTIFGPQVPDWFVPTHPAAEWTPGKACPYKPCSDYCRFDKPLCLTELSEEEIAPQIENFLSRCVEKSSPPSKSATES